ncbi:hypothetical protein M5K25_025389 [Dendrobium thyrsiflorum]|uniref:Methenyltetrahydrofolate cyclohydrolase n=1 Tax=Dendrobium thyrsiflorum TaxID=117978 RepID=A0ABD0U4B4_DENTH
MTTESSSIIIDGKLVAKKIRDEITSEVARIKDSTGIVPGLAVILVGSRKDSQTYVRNKKKACEEVGIESFEVSLPEDCTEEDIIKHISDFNSNPSVHGILVQLPLPQHINEEKILNSVTIEKDVDGFHPLNIGRLAMQGRDPLFVPCTPKGCMELLHKYNVEIKGKRAVVIGRSNIVGMPAALLLQRANATISIVHSKTKNPEEIIRQADILISAAGVPNLVRGSWLKPGAVVIDVGINAVDNPTRGSRDSPSTHQSDSATSSPHHTAVTHFSATFVETNRGHYCGQDHPSLSNIRVAAPPYRSSPSLDGRPSIGSSFGSVSYDSPLGPTPSHLSQPLASPDLDPASVILVEKCTKKKRSPEPETECIHFVDANDITDNEDFFEDETEAIKLGSLHDLNPDLGELEPLNFNALVNP